MKKRKEKDGGILVMAMIVLLAFSVLAIGLLKLHDTDALETVHVKHTAQAFWMAETGLQRTLSKLRTDKSYREGISTDENFPNTETNTFGNGAYAVKLWNNGSEGGFVIESLGIVREAERLLRLEAGLSDFGQYGLITLNGDSRMFKDGSIIGSVYQNGNLTVAGGVNITGEVLAGNYEDFEQGAAIPEDGVLDLSIDTDYFNAYLTLGSTHTPEADPLLLGGATVVFNSSIDPSVIGGPGILVILDNQTFLKDLVVSNDVAIIVAGDLKISRDGTFGDNVTLFATGEMDLFKNAIADVETGTGCAFLALEDMKIKKELTFDGLIFSEGEIMVDKDLVVSGTIITQEGFTLKNNASVTFDSTVISDEVRDKMILSTFYVQSGIWNELPVN